MNSELILQNLPLARRIAARRLKKLPPSVEPDDVQAAAYLGLVQAAQRYDGRTSFSAYAATRIKGEINDFLRKQCWGGRASTLIVKPIDFFPDLASLPEKENHFYELIECLDEIKRQMLVLRFIEERSWREIGKIMDLRKNKLFKVYKQSLEEIKCKLMQYR